MIRVIIKSAAVVERRGRNSRGEWLIREQVAWAYYHNVDGEEPFPTKLILRLDDGATPYAPGEYRIAPSSFARGDYDSIGVRRVELVPAAQAPSRAA